MNMKNRINIILCFLFLNIITFYISAQTSIPINEEFTSKVCTPARGKVISQFGMRNHRMHTGTDIKQDKNDSILCAFDGIVKKSSFCSGYGNLVVVQHKNGVETYYAHLRKSAVKPNEIINAGQLIGYAGATGRATTTHLHFEIRIQGKPINAYNVLGFQNDDLKTCVLQYDYAPTTTSVNNEIASTESYTVQKKDTLYAIAIRYNTSIGTLCSLNNISKTSTLQPGQVLKVR
jgi:murein DD-endopeptidase MepM/ murein hydrolase activator NlpD